MPNRIAQPQYPRPIDEPTPDEMAAFNLAVIADRLEVLGNALEGIAGGLERISQHLYDIKGAR